MILPQLSARRQGQALSRIKAPSILDINLFAGSWLIMGITLGFVVSRAVFAPGRVTHHHIMGAILLYLTIAITFVALLTFGEVMHDRSNDRVINRSCFLPEPTIARNSK